MTIWYALMFATGLCSMIYELALAQLLSGLMGNSLARFATTLGVYVVGLGIGSLAFRSRDDARDGRLFFAAELAIFFVGFISPFLFIAFHNLASSITADPDSRAQLILVSTHSVIFLTGFLSGFELPILSAIASRKEKQGDSAVLSSDYLGMFAASLLFPLVLFPVFGLAPSFWLATLINLFAAGVTYWFIGGRSRLVYSAVALVGVINIGALAAAPQIQIWLSQVYAATH